MTLTDRLNRIMRNELPLWTGCLDGWSSLDVDYSPPRVERLWRQVDADHRLYLHRIHPCEEALFHPHPWPSAVHVLSGGYEMGVGFGVGTEVPEVAAKLVLVGGARYEMTNTDGWHYVRPLGGPSLSLMLTGQPWSRPSPGKDANLKPLSLEGAENLLEAFRWYFPHVA